MSQIHLSMSLPGLPCLVLPQKGELTVQTGCAEEVELSSRSWLRSRYTWSKTPRLLLEKATAGK
jgi:hypothetical protein